MRLGTRFAARVPGSVAGLAAVFWMAAGPPDVHAQEVTGEPAEPDYFVVEGRVFTADGRTPRGLRVFVRTPARTDSAAVRPTGEFAVVTVVQAADSVEVFIDAADRDARWYYPSWVRLSPEELWEDLRFVLIPRAWRIEDGVYGGEFVEISLAAAFAPAEEDTVQSFYRRMPVWRGWERPYTPLSWPPEAFPIRIVFLREPGQRGVTAEDSIAFWFAVREMERHFGEKLFHPGRAEDNLQGDTVEGAIAVRFDRDQVSDGWGRAQWRRDGTIHRGTVAFRERKGMGNVRLVTHELLHALGFGHTCEGPR